MLDMQDDTLRSVHKGQSPEQRTHISTCSCKIVSLLQHALLPKPVWVAKLVSPEETNLMRSHTNANTHISVNQTQVYVLKVW